MLRGVHQYDGSLQIPDFFRNVVCALDDSPACVPLFRWGHELSGIFGARLKCVHAIPAVDETSESRGKVEVRRYLFTTARKHFNDYFAAEPEQTAWIYVEVRLRE